MTSVILFRCIRYRVAKHQVRQVIDHGMNKEMDILGCDGQKLSGEREDGKTL